MRKLILTSILCFLFVFGSFSIAQTTSAKGYYDYSGDLNEKTTMTLSLYNNNNGQLTGGYVLSGSHLLVPLVGSTTDSKVVLKELDRNHKPIATFEGTIGADDAIVGERTDLKSGKTQSFHWALQAILSGTRSGHRYENAGFSSDAVVEHMAQKIQKALKEGDKNTIANAIHYPLAVHINNERVIIKNSKAFIAQYNGIFHPTFKKTLLDEPTCFMFANDQGVMFGSGSNNLWLGSRTLGTKKYQPAIIGINN